MSFAKDMQNTATELLNEFDEDKKRLILVKAGGDAVWDPVLAEMVPQASTEIELIGVTVQFFADMVNNTTIQSGDVMVMAAYKEGVTVTTQDKLKIDGETWSIEDVPKSNYTGLTLLYKIHCRK